MGVNRIRHSDPGWFFLFKGIEFTTSKLDSIDAKNRDGTSPTFITAKFFDNSFNELTTQASIDSSCTNSAVYFEPPFDYDLICGFISCIDNVTENLHAYATLAPQISSEAGGCKQFICNLPLHAFSQKTPMLFDGKSSKKLIYDSTHHTNELELLVKHPAGLQKEIAFGLEFFRE